MAQWLNLDWSRIYLGLIPEVAFCNYYLISLSLSFPNCKMNSL